MFGFLPQASLLPNPVSGQCCPYPVKERSRVGANGWLPGHCGGTTGLKPVRTTHLFSY